MVARHVRLPTTLLLSIEAYPDTRAPSLLHVVTRSKRVVRGRVSLVPPLAL